MPMMNETDGLRQLTSMPQGGAPTAPQPGARPMPTPGAQPGISAAGPSAGGAPGARGIDTPQEQKAMQLLAQAATLVREAANTEPSIRYIADKYLVSMFTDVTKHYGLEEEGKLALQQAQMQKRNQSIAGRTGPPTGAGAPTAAPTTPQASI